MKVIITGASGMIGRGVLLECLDSPAVEKVLVIGRSSCGESHPKLEELLHKDFSDYSAIEGQLAGYDACFWCLGVSAAGMSEEKYRQITYDYTLALAKTLRRLSPGMTFCYVSGQGTDSTEKGSQMWARVKGKTENDLLALGVARAFMFRPGVIQPKRGIRSKTTIYNIAYIGLGWLLAIIKALSPNAITDTTRHGLAMINVAKNGYSKQLLDNKDINTLAGI